MTPWMSRWLVARGRGRLAHRILSWALPRAIVRRFDPGAAEDLTATLKLTIRDPHGRPDARYEVTVADGACSVARGDPERPGAAASISSDDLLLLAGGVVGWPELLSSGRFELTGDPFLALRFASLFQLPVALEPVSA
jgi:hypothetical protein